MSGAEQSDSISATGEVASRWPLWLARTMVILVWPLIWVGGLVTTYDAGMSVPDWPGTYGYNLFLYPLSTWLLGPFDLFIEHGHRLLGALVGFVAIGFLVAAWLTESRGWVKWLAVAVLLAVIGQGVLGGLRVTMSARTLAMVHGCTGPLFFALCVIAACVVGRRWSRTSVLSAAGMASESNENASNQSEPNQAKPAQSELNQAKSAQSKPDQLSSAVSALPSTPKVAWGLVLIVLAYLQLVLGAILRHALPDASAAGFGHTAMTHVTVAFGLWLLTGLAFWRMRRCGDLTLSRPAAGLICFVGVQILLGVGTWIVNYGYPPILQSLPGSDAYLLQAKNLLDAWVVTGHVATGSLILAVSTLLAVRLSRRRWVLRTISNP
ncbi:cytochrome c oxidase assembly protein subunit 15 [Neorhodopirellula lusitana]|uniref:Cytochrome c oxidase assembly protein subunit 15 n=1 Tax=Neorhodopirellula lusitana TaxID=445327 RepID=A0ABY1Q708_9BACT|nr:COX15/CtaA family protein [Neorhodopirellula lusitana]SMP61679.1 cytochrome c oxidase assembly protein subunit 15 [Neorhodopirellula lusitana]